ncbi:hypothetical protein EXS73_03770, partial [Candidatus Pacearchaeota archaeon]|nr:hypothetical protein [Candidatus Pacearchaeota archaeon]
MNDKQFISYGSFVPFSASSAGNLLKQLSFYNSTLPEGMYVVFGHSAGEIEGLSSFLGDAIPTGAILLFNTTCPSGWTRFSGLDGRVPKGG